MRLYSTLSIEPFDSSSTSQAPFYQTSPPGASTSLRRGHDVRNKPCVRSIVPHDPIHSRDKVCLRNAEVQQPLNRAPTHPILILFLRRAPDNPSHSSSVSIHAIDIRRSSWDDKHVSMVQDHIISFARLQADFISQGEEELVQSCSVGMSGQKACGYPKRDLAKATREGCTAVVNEPVLSLPHVLPWETFDETYLRHHCQLLPAKPPDHHSRASEQPEDAYDSAKRRRPSRR